LKTKKNREKKTKIDVNVLRKE